MAVTRDAQPLFERYQTLAGTWDEYFREDGTPRSGPGASSRSSSGSA
ncbi:MAG: hypothetical protein R3E53_18020 [Myxococcota bacterium]